MVLAAVVRVEFDLPGDVGLAANLDMAFGLENADDAPAITPTTVTAINAKRSRFVENIVEIYLTTVAFSRALTRLLSPELAESPR